MSVIQKIAGRLKGVMGVNGIAERSIVQLTSAQIKALNTTPVVLVPAPGAGRYIEVISINGKLTFGTTQYTGANAVEIRYTDGSGAKATSDLAAAWLNSASSRVDKATGAAVTAVANAPIVASVPTANPGAGDGTVVFDVLYRNVGLSTT